MSLNDTRIRNGQSRSRKSAQGNKWNFCLTAGTRPNPIKPTSTRCNSAWQPNPGRRSTYRRGDSVQTTGTGSPSVLEITFANRNDYRFTESH